MGRLAALLAAVLCLAGCERSAESGEATVEAAPPPVLTVGHVGHDHHLALYVAALAGEDLAPGAPVFLREVKAREQYDLVENGTTLARLSFVRVEGGSKMPAAMSAGSIDIGLGGVPAVIRFADQGAPLKIIAPLQTDGDMLALRADSPVTDWPSFVARARQGGKPLVIGYKAPSAVAKLVFVGALQAEGLTWTDRPGERADVVLLNMGGEGKAVPLLAAGQIDGFVMNQPVVALAADRGLAKVVADLRDLPPAGRWLDHPCCCVAATEQTLAEHGPAVKALLKTILLATDRIRRDQPYAIQCAVEWIRNSESVEGASVPTVVYLAEPTDRWLAGMATWLSLMEEVDAMGGRYAARPAEQVVADVCDLALCRQAADELRQAGWLGARE